MKKCADFETLGCYTHPHMRVLLATLASLALVGFVIIMTRIWGMGQTFQEYKTPYLEGQTPYVAVKAHTLAKMAEAIDARPDVIIWADVRISNNRVPFILPPSRDVEFLNAKMAEQEANPKAQIMLGSKLSNFSWEQINEFYKSTPALKELYEKFPKTRFILNVVDNVTDVDSLVANAVQDYNSNDRTLIQSDANVITNAIKSLQPTWLYGTSKPDLMRLMSFDSLWVLPSTQFKGDVFIAPFKIQNRPAFNDNVLAEMRRRKKKIFLVVENEEEFKKAVEIKADGYVANDINQITSWLATTSAK
ncbi:hypothetical protein [Bdellovibrio sp. KM01]|uniref:hypothetical protein n=1 Tax=Bdellovibrio sp. KM01 TaxID=2748865 RepID=UPI0021029C14|nr:hypothetical protein [Bdellovibrio sp. KM01]